MSFSTFAANLLPYWILGLWIVTAVFTLGHGKLLRIDFKALLKFVKFLSILTIYRVVLVYVSKKLHMPGVENQAKTIIALPWQATLFTPWEDAVFGLPLVIMNYLYGDKKYFKIWFYPLVAFVMIGFSSGHVYQGYLSAALLSLYIPYSLKLSKEYGVGTVMAGHIMFDLATILTFKFMLG